MAGRLGGQPIIILKDTERMQGRDAQSMNIHTAKTVAGLIRSTLGPKGMDKMLVDSIGDVYISNDGASILDDIETEHPTAKMIIEVAHTQEDEAGDGTTSAVVFAGELLKKAEELLAQKIHATTIVKGYKIASKKAQELLDNMAISVKAEDGDLLKKIAITALASKGIGSNPKLAEKCVKAVKAIEDNGRINVEENIMLLKKRGKSVDETEFVNGLVIDKMRVSISQPRKIKKAKIALFDQEIQARQTKGDAKYKIRSSKQMQLFAEEEKRLMKQTVERIASTGANVVFSTKNIEDNILDYFNQKNILGIRRTKEEDLKKLARATDANIVSNPEELEESDLGYAGIVEERGVGNYKMFYIEECENPKSVTLVLHGPSEYILENLEGSVNDALHVIGDVIEDGKIIAGGSAPEIEVGLRLREYASTLSGREQLAVQAFAEAIEIIPYSLAENSGLNPIDSLVDLRSKHKQGHKNSGLDLDSGDVVDMIENGIIEPLRVKKQMMKSATEAADMLLRIDDIFAARRMSMEEKYGGKGYHMRDYDWAPHPKIDED
ncbi:MAG: thermosome subunit alpha [Methanosarcinales archaeon]